MQPNEERVMHQGLFDDHLDVTQATFIQGAVTQGATVRSGGRLVVQGAVAGPLTIEEGGALSVQGALTCEEWTNAGVVTVAGVVTGKLPSDGIVLVSPGTVLVDGGSATVLRLDGSLEPIEGDINHLDIDAAQPKFRRMQDGTFVRFDPSPPTESPPG